ncbi:MAG: valine--tRNA ligase, partial [Candidatus Angelobacter sp.]
RWLSEQAEEEVAMLQDLIVNVRNLRAEMKVEPRAKTPVRVHAPYYVRLLFQENHGMIERLANVERIEFAVESLSNAAGTRSAPKFDVMLVYERKVDAAAEKERLSKELGKLEAQLASAQRQLGNQQFLAKAPATVVDGLKKQATETALLIEKDRIALASLG